MTTPGRNRAVRRHRQEKTENTSAEPETSLSASWTTFFEDIDAGAEVTIDAGTSSAVLADIVKDEDLSRYCLTNFLLRNVSPQRDHTDEIATSAIPDARDR